MFTNLGFPLFRAFVFFLLSSVCGWAIAEDTVLHTKLGQNEYARSCAACHGESAKGDGPVASVLTKAPPDLTMISQRNGGNFPTIKIYQTIDGAAAMGPHGSKEMPIWGDRYRVEALGQIAGVPHDLSPEAIVHARILSLVYYLQSIQQ
jgi:mono/diheme cytochrome c family protein